MGIRVRKEQARRPLLEEKALHPRKIDVKADVAEEEQKMLAFDFRQQQQKCARRAERRCLFDIVELHAERTAVSEVVDNLLFQVSDHQGYALYPVALQLLELPFKQGLSEERGHGLRNFVFCERRKATALAARHDYCLHLCSSPFCLLFSGRLYHKMSFFRRNILFFIFTAHCYTKSENSNCCYYCFV